MSWRGLLTACLLMLLGLGLLAPYTPQVIREVYAQSSMWPSDGDAWTENNNATYEWRVHPTYNDSIEFTTEEAYVGTYSLKVNHTSATTRFYFGLDIGMDYNYTSNNMDVLVFWIMHKNWDYGTSLRLYLHNDGWWITTDTWRIIPKPKGQKWVKVVLPINAWRVLSGTPEDTIRYIAIEYTGGVTAQSYQTIYIDGMHFANYDTPSFDDSFRDDTYMPNYYWALTNYFEKKVVYNGKSYTSVYLAVNKSSGAKSQVGSLESEYLGLIIWFYSLAYQETKSPTLLSKLKSYGNWLLQLEDDTVKGAIHDSYDNATDTFEELASNVNTGWVLAGLSILYSITGNSTYKTVCDNIREFLISKLWNATNGWFDAKYNITSGTRIYSTSWDYMRQGAVQLGLASYYRYVSQNSTVKTIFDTNFNKNSAAPFASNGNAGIDWAYKFSRGNAEDSTYVHWAMWQGYHAFSNETYLDACYATERALTNYMVNPNGSMAETDWMADPDYDNTLNYLDNWHGAGQYLWLALEEIRPIGGMKAQRFYENMTFGYYPSIWNSSNQLYSHKTNGGSSNQQWNSLAPFSAAQYAGLVKYYMDFYKPTYPFVLLSNGKVTSTSFSNKKLTLTVDASSGATTTTEIYVPAQGKPSTVKGASSWQYDSTNKILTITAQHSSPTTITIEWGQGEVPGGPWEPPQPPQLPNLRGLFRHLGVVLLLLALLAVLAFAPKRWRRALPL